MSRTLVTFHAHPDDEAIATGGVMAAAAEQGWRVVLVVATRGEHGEVADGFLADGETLGQRREVETLAAAKILGVDRVEFLGYTDSGMVGEDTNFHHGSFWSADVEDAAERLAAILAEEDAEILTVYDHNGVYGHPDHIQVHRVGVRAGEIAGTPKVYEQTMDRDRFRELMAMRIDLDPDEELPDVDVEAFGLPGHMITTRVDVTAWAHLKRDAMAAHASQIGPDSMFLSLPEEPFKLAFGLECYILRGAPEDLQESSLW